TTRPKEIWQALLLLAAALWPIDVGIRRLHLTREQLQYAAARFRSFVARRPASELAEANPALGKLKTARARLRLSDKLVEQSSRQSSNPSTEAVPYASSDVEATETGDASSPHALEEGERSGGNPERESTEAQPQAKPLASRLLDARQRRIESDSRR